MGTAPADMKVVLLHAVVQPVFLVMDEGRPVRMFSPQSPWVRFHGELAGLAAEIEAFEAKATAEMEAADGGQEERGQPGDRPARGACGEDQGEGGHQGGRQEEPTEAR